VVIAIIAILAAMLLPALARAKAQAQTAQCASNMRNWAMATTMYVSDFKETLESFGDEEGVATAQYWHAKLAPYVARFTQLNTSFDATEIWTNAVRKCPGGSTATPPFCTSARDPGTWNCWIGAVFGDSSDPTSAPFAYNDFRPPLKVVRVHIPAAAMLYMDSIDHYIYSPGDHGTYAQPLTLDLDHDKVRDSYIMPSGVAYSNARPTVHDNGANCTLLDGHVERVPFKILWKCDGTGMATHPFWHVAE
jgi:prepilin-type processing-associated H-X9-DG protein